MTGGDAIGRSYRANGIPHYTVYIGGNDDPDCSDARVHLGPYGTSGKALAAGREAARTGEKIAVMCHDDADDDLVSVVGVEWKS